MNFFEWRQKFEKKGKGILQKNQRWGVTRLNWVI